MLDLGSKLAELGLLTLVIDLGPESADAGSFLLSEGALAVVNGNPKTGRRRLALAHEFAQVLLQGDCTTDWWVDSTAASREAATDRFARLLLLPRAHWNSFGSSGVETRREPVGKLLSGSRAISVLTRRLLRAGWVSRAWWMRRKPSLSGGSQPRVRT